MVLDAAKGHLLVQHAQFIAVPAVRDALAYLVGQSTLDPEFRCHANVKGKVREFQIHDASGNQPFALIVNRNSLLFYFRLPALRSGRYSLVDLRARFAEARANTSGELTVRVLNIEDARRVWGYATSSEEYHSRNSTPLDVSQVNRHQA